MRVPVLLLLLPLLAGCSDADWDHLTSFDSSAAPAEIAAAEPAATAAPATPAGAPNAFCLNVAKQDAMGDGFDQATQQRVALRSYSQCVSQFGSQN